MNDIGWTDAEIRASREKSAEIKDAYKRGYDQARKEFERPQGEWKVDEKIYCSECGAILWDFVPNPTDAVVIITENKFCFNCGAKMKGGAE